MGTLPLALGITYAIAQVVGMILLYRKFSSASSQKSSAPSEININLSDLKRQMSDIPRQVLQGIKLSSNSYKGTLGELIGYMELHARYDRIVPLNSIVDFMCIRFPTKDIQGSVDFIDVKTGDNSRLSKDQKKLQKLIKNKKIKFIKLKVQTSTVTPKVDNEDSTKGA